MADHDVEKSPLKKPKATRLKGYSVPLPAVLLLSSLLVALSIAVPIAVISSKGAEETVDTVVSNLRQNYAELVTTKVLAIGAAVHRLAQVAGTHPEVLEVIENLPAPNVAHNFLDDKQFVYSFYQLAITLPFVISAGFGRSNLVDQLYVGPAGLHCFNLSLSDSKCDRIFVTQAFPENYTVNVDTIPDAIDYPLPPPPDPELMAAEPPTPAYGRPMWFSVPKPDGTYSILGVGVFYWSMWKGAPLGSRTSQPSTGFLEIDFDVNEFSVILQDMKLTKHAIIAIWDYTGSMFAVSQAGQLHDGKSAVPTTYTAEAHPLEDISVPASSMKAKFGSYENYPETYAETYTTSAGVLLTNVVKIEKYGARWFILISIPETDITGPLVAARKKLIITSSVVGVVMLGFAAGLSVLVTMPLRRLSAIMVQATGMDFSSLSQGYLKKKNPISEIAAMQEIFSNMLDRFAKAIQSNKELQSRPMTTSGIKSKRSDSVA